MTCPIYEAYQDLDAVRAEIVDMILDDEDGYDAAFASESIFEVLSAGDVPAVIEPEDVRQHREGECTDGGLLVRRERDR